MIHLRVFGKLLGDVILQHVGYGQIQFYIRKSQLFDVPCGDHLADLLYHIVIYLDYRAVILGNRDKDIRRYEFVSVMKPQQSLGRYELLSLDRIYRLVIHLQRSRRNRIPYLLIDLPHVLLIGKIQRSRIYHGSSVETALAHCHMHQIIQSG